jgi:phi13 family phage major tail protein
MATIGLDKPYFATITEGEGGVETYGTPAVLAKAIQADLTVNLAEAILYADDGADVSVKEFQSGTLSLNVNDIGTANAAALTGATVDANGALVSCSEDIPPYVAIGFRAKKPNGKYRYFWLYRTKFGVPSTNLATKGESITFQTPTIEGTVMRRNKPDAQGKHPWKTEVTEGDTGVTAATISGWFNAVYEPTFAAAQGGNS